MSHADRMALEVERAHPLRPIVHSRSSSRKRWIAFESYTRKKLEDQGFTVSRGRVVDFVATMNGRTLFVECKDPQSFDVNGMKRQLYVAAMQLMEERFLTKDRAAELYIFVNAGHIPQPWLDFIRSLGIGVIGA
jgi:hypothetical protein